MLRRHEHQPDCTCSKCYLRRVRRHARGPPPSERDHSPGGPAAETPKATAVDDAQDNKRTERHREPAARITWCPRDASLAPGGNKRHSNSRRNKDDDETDAGDEQEEEKDNQHQHHSSKDGQGRHHHKDKHKFQTVSSSSQGSQERRRKHDSSSSGSGGSKSHRRHKHQHHHKKHAEEKETEEEQEHVSDHDNKDEDEHKHKHKQQHDKDKHRRHDHDDQAKKDDEKQHKHKKTPSSSSLASSSSSSSSASNKKKEASVSAAATAPPQSSSASVASSTASSNNVTAAKAAVNSSDSLSLPENDSTDNSSDDGDVISGITAEKKLLAGCARKVHMSEQPSSSSSPSCHPRTVPSSSSSHSSSSSSSSCSATAKTDSDATASSSSTRKWIKRLGMGGVLCGCWCLWTLRRYNLNAAVYNLLRGQTRLDGDEIEYLLRPFQFPCFTLFLDGNAVVVREGDEATALLLQIEVLNSSGSKPSVLIKHRIHGQTVEQALVISNDMGDATLEFVNIAGRPENLAWDVEVVYEAIYDMNMTSCFDLEYTIVRLSFVTADGTRFFLALLASDDGNSTPSLALVRPAQLKSRNVLSLWFFDSVQPQRRATWFDKILLAGYGWQR